MRVVSAVWMFLRYNERWSVVGKGGFHEMGD